MTKLDEILMHIKKKYVYIQTHNFPDPDAIASAYGLQYLLKTKGIEASICYKGEIDRFSTLRMIQNLNIEIMHIQSNDIILKDDEILLVDSQKGNSNVSDLDGEEVICIDHHQTFEDVSYRFCDIRPGVGACASIVTQYFIENEIEMKKEVATALLYGIKIDTANLCRGVSELDLDMYYFLYKQADLDLVQKLEHSILQISDLEAYANAIHSIKVYEQISFANTGRNCPEPLIASISDFMMSIADVSVSVVYSIREDGIKLSARSKYPNYNVGEMCNQVLRGIGNGGGHDIMAGGFVPFQGSGLSEEAMIALIEQKFKIAFEANSQDTN